jgi:hypothetical protein
MKDQGEFGNAAAQHLGKSVNPRVCDAVSEASAVMCGGSLEGADDLMSTFKSAVHAGKSLAHGQLPDAAPAPGMLSEEGYKQTAKIRADREKVLEKLGKAKGGTPEFRELNNELESLNAKLRGIK